MSANATLDIPELTKQLESVFGKKLEEFNAEQKAATAKAIEEKFKAYEAELARKSAVFSLPGSADATHKGRKFSLVRAIAGLITGDFSICEMERAMHNEVKAKAMSFGSDTAGGFLVPNEVMLSEIIPLLRAESVAMQLGATQIGVNGKAPLQIPRVSGGTTAYWVAEAGTITSSDLTLEQLQLTPRMLAALTVVSDLLSVLDSPGIENMIRQDMAQALALKLDLAVMKGTGGTQPQGIIGYTGVNTTTISDPATYDQLLAAISEVRADNALAGRLGWAVSNADMLELEQIKDVSSGGTNTSHQQLQRRQLLNPDGTQLLGYPIKVSTQLADGNIIFGNWADVVIAQWGGLRLEATNAVGFTSAQNHIRALTYVDVGLRHPQSFCVPA
jgi:HK97 family phage major capsid protein